MDAGERLAAYLTGELDAGERAALEAEVARDPALRNRLERLRRADQALASLPAIEPSPEFSQRLRTAVADELRRTAAKEPSRVSRALRPLLAAAAAAAVVAVVGIGTLFVRSGGDTGAESRLTSLAEPTVAIRETDNDFDRQALRRLAVNVDTSGVVPPGLKADEARPLADQLTSQILGKEPSSDRRAGTTSQQQGPAAGVEEAAPAAPPAPGARPAGEDAVQRCLPALLTDARSPLVPVYVELARFSGEAAIIYVFAAEDPASDTYRRIEVWAVSRADCHVLSFAQYDRPGADSQR